jgi:hypothetical protein
VHAYHLHHETHFTIRKSEFKVAACTVCQVLPQQRFDEVVGESRAAAAAVPGEVGGDSRAVPGKSRAVAGESRTAAAVLCSMGFGGRIVDWMQETAVGRGGGDLKKNVIIIANGGRLNANWTYLSSKPSDDHPKVQFLSFQSLHRFLICIGYVPIFPSSPF